MSKRKFKILIDITLLFLCLLPIIALLCVVATSSTILTAEQIEAQIMNFCISNDLAEKIGESINTFGIQFDGAFYSATCALIANAVLVHVFYVFIATLVFVPKMAIKFLNFTVGGKN